MLDDTEIKIICDFDGTVTPFDTTDAILERFALPEWRIIEKLWMEGKITSRECMARQISMICATRQELDDFIDRFPLTEGFKEFFFYCRLHGLNFCVVSDGVDYTINRILTNHGLTGIPVMANHLVIKNDSYALTFPTAKEGCNYGMCKCKAADVQNNRIMLIGDSRSDTCLARNAEQVFARQGFALEEYCLKNKINYTPFNHFFDVLENVGEYRTHKQGNFHEGF